MHSYCEKLKKKKRTYVTAWSESNFQDWIRNIIYITTRNEAVIQYWALINDDERIGVSSQLISFIENLSRYWIPINLFM